MSQISNNYGALVAHRDLVRANQRLTETMQRLSTGLKINTPADNPSGWIASQWLDNQVAAIEPALDQAQRMGNLLATADAGLGQISDLLLEIQQLVAEAANTTGMNEQMLAANQMQIDAAVDSIHRLTMNTQFAGRTLLDGTLACRVADDNPAELSDVQIMQANYTGDYLPALIDVAAAATGAQLQFRSSQAGADVTLSIAGRRGSQTIRFAAGATASAMQLAINQLTYETGVSASFLNAANPASGLTFSSMDVGARSFVSVEAIRGTFDTATTAGAAATRSAGTDAVATLNGLAVQADGNTLSFHTAELQGTARIADGFTGRTQFSVQSTGANFLSGPDRENNLGSFGIPSTLPSNLGSGDVGWLTDIVTGGAYSLSSGKISQAAGIVSAAQSQVASLRGQIGGLAKNTIDRGIESMNMMIENATSSMSAIRDADYAAETANLARDQLMVQVATSILATTNSNRDMVLQILAG